MNDTNPSKNGAILTERASKVHALGLEDLFLQADSPCFCQYWQFEGDSRQWQDRCANARQENSAALLAEFEAGDVDAVVASEEGKVVGWARVHRAAQLQKLYTGRLYRSLPCLEANRSTTRVLSCFLVHPERRRNSVARALLEAAIELARQLGAEQLEAFPRGALDVSDEEQWMGPVALYEEARFSKIHDFAPYPIYRLQL